MRANKLTSLLNKEILRLEKDLHTKEAFYMQTKDNLKKTMTKAKKAQLKALDAFCLNQHKFINAVLNLPTTSKRFKAIKAAHYKRLNNLIKASKLAREA